MHLRLTSVSDTNIRTPTEAKALTPSEALARLWTLPETTKLPPSREWIYFLQTQTDPKLIKIGKSQELRWRVITIQHMCPIALKLVGAVSAPAGTEQVLHAKFRDLRYFGEWFFASAQLLEFIKSLPKGESLPVGMAEAWSSETGQPLLRRFRRRTYREKGIKVFEQELAADKEATRYWNREHRDLD